MAKPIKAQVPVVIVGGSLNSLGVVRSLSRQGMPIFVVETSRRCASGWSRYCQLIRVRSLEGYFFIQDLKRISARIGRRPVLILTDDRAVETVSTYREQIEPYFRLSLPSREQVKILADKTLFQIFAEKEGLSVPKSVVLDHSANFPSLLQSLTLPVVIKPANKAHVLNGQADRAVRADTALEAHATSARMLMQVDRLIVQEWIDGPDTEIFFTLFVCDDLGQVVGLFSGRKVVCDPPRIGNTALCVAADEASEEALEALTRDFIARVHYKGIGSLEFKRDCRNGRFVMVEPTVGRTDWQEEIATLCGVNIPKLAYQIATCTPLDEPSLDRKRKFAWRSSWIHRAPAGELRRRTRMVDGYFRFNDPLPALYYYGFEATVVRLWNAINRVFRCLTSKPNLSGIEVEKKA